MDILKLKNNDATEENVLKIINHIKDVETEAGLTQDKIEHKYTHGYCASLVEIVTHFLPECRSICFWSYEEFAHFCIGIESKFTNSSDYKDLDYFDINGKRSYNEMVEWMAKEFNGDIKEIHIKEMPVSRQNNISEIVYKSVNIEQEEQTSFL